MARTAGEKRKETVVITGHHLEMEEVIRVARYHAQVALSKEAREGIQRSHQTVRQKIDEGRPVYGITTGFGKLSSVAINQEESRQLQRNLIMSHACGVGKPFPEEIVRGIMLLRANNLSKGHSGVNLQVVETLLAMLNKGVCPVVPEKGSLGASGDLANLAHVALVMIGLGEAVHQGQKKNGAQAMHDAGIPVVELSGKDGLGLINGTQVMMAMGIVHLHDAEQLLHIANIAAAMTLEAARGLTAAFDPRIHAVRPHPGQMACAGEVLALVAGSGYVNQAQRVQDAYSLRCVPQVHGATLDTINYVRTVLDIELNAVTDNPIVFPEDGEIISGGNFHGQPLALAMDFLGIAVAELANISERRIERLVNPQLSELPAFLAQHSGINSGYMIAQYTAAALVSENKVFASPASVDSIPTSANQEDHVSMGANAARKAGEIIQNVRAVLGIELMCAAQGIDLRDKEKLGEGTQRAYDLVRSRVPFLESDRVLYPDIAAVQELLCEDGFVAKVLG